MKKEEIIFKLSEIYSQEQNGVFEQMKMTIIDIIRATILEKNIDNNL